jgi:hypothetical protein
MRSRGILGGAWWVALCLAAGCGGRADSGSGSGTGPLASCGDSCSPAQVTASCSGTCDKIARAQCSSGSGDCVTGCADTVSMTPACSSLALAFLRCLETQEPTCSDSGTAQYFGGCDSQQQALETCFVGSSNPAKGPAGTVPASVCPDIPRPSAGESSCSAGASVMPGSNGPATCNVSCQDGKRNTWAADCSGSSCTCTYNGGLPCTCVMTGSGCSSCCPGTQ